MGKPISKKLEWVADGRLCFWCPGCKTHHVLCVAHGTGRPSWDWDGDAVAPTFSPSILVQFPANPNADEEFKEWRKERVCHSFVRSGMIQFLSDCTHELAGQTVALPDLPGGGA